MRGGSLEAALEWIVKGVLPATRVGGPNPDHPRLTGWTFPVQGMARMAAQQRPQLRGSRCRLATDRTREWPQRVARTLAGYP
jgi:hypothetical protein